jgi:hypothetical protein
VKTAEEGLGKVAVPVGAGTFEIEVLSKGSLEPGEPAQPQVSTAVSAQHPRYGYWHTPALMRRHWFEVNTKREASTRDLKNTKDSVKISYEVSCSRGHANYGKPTNFFS